MILRVKLFYASLTRRTAFAIGGILCFVHGLIHALSGCYRKLIHQKADFSLFTALSISVQRHGIPVRGANKLPYKVQTNPLSQEHLKLLLHKEWLVRVDGNKSIPYLLVRLILHF